MDAAASNPTYRAHWGLREAPFASGLNPRHYHQSLAHEEALARLQFLVEQHQQVGLLLGGPGTGKSLLLEVLARDLRRQGSQVANVSLLGIDVHELLWLLAAELGLNPSPQADVFSLWRGTLDRLAENRSQQLHTIVLLDDADEASPEVLDQVVRLAQADRGSQNPAVVVLSAASQSVGRLGLRLLELADLRIDLEPWEEADTAAYLLAALEQAGCRSPVFSDDAVGRLQMVSGGIPRRVNQLAALALVAGAGRRLPRIDAETIDAVYHELGAVDAVA